MPRKKRTILLVPPQSGNVRHLRVRKSIIIFLGVCMITGFAGYFIPFNSYTLDVAEQNQKKNLSIENHELLERILTLYKSLRDIQSEIGKVEDQKQSILAISRAGTIVEKERDSAAVPVAASILDIGRLSRIVAVHKNGIGSFFSSLQKDDDYFATVPLLLPVKGRPVVSVPFGKTHDPFTNKVKWHQGLDFIGPRDLEICATADGVVTRVTKDSKWGWMVVIRHSSEFETLFAHLGKPATRARRRVKRGDTIGYMGVSGISSGPHLHYEIHRNGTPVNPREYIYPLLDRKIVMTDQVRFQE